MAPPLPSVYSQLSPKSYVATSPNKSGLAAVQSIHDVSRHYRLAAKPMRAVLRNLNPCFGREKSCAVKSLDFERETRDASITRAKTAPRA